MANLTGIIKVEDVPITQANIILEKTNLGTSTNIDGQYQINNIPNGTYKIQVSHIGFMPIIDSVTIENGQSQIKNFTLVEDVLNLSQVIVSGNRKRVKRYNSPIVVNTIDMRTFDANQSLDIAGGLSFSSGLRVESNCQNCGFTQLRMNGLEGPYSQILINSRPIFSALAGIYGLEMIPANMVDRIEIVKGGGSLMYGGNAIAGTINIITKKPTENSFEILNNYASINGEAPDEIIQYNGSLVSKNLDAGLTLYGFKRNRDHWDANKDSFSEIVKLKNNTVGLEAFYDLDNKNKFELGTYYINEYRRGGNKFDLKPHQSDIAEKLEHDIAGVNLTFDHFGKNNIYKFKLYSALQHVKRGSYYGSGGRIIEEGETLTNEDILAINAYGDSKDLSTVNGFQYNLFINSNLNLSLGSEHFYNNVMDGMPGYERLIDQTVSTWGNFAELEVKLLEKLTLNFGGRFEKLSIDGSYDLESEKLINDRNLKIFIPRISAMYKIQENLKLRSSHALGYRGPQAFDEDLHIETVGGAASFHHLSSDLKMETSKSSTISINYDKFYGQNQMNFLIEGFYTQLIDPFIFSDRKELPSGIAMETKRNGNGAYLAGVNFEANAAFGSDIILQSGGTAQVAKYNHKERIWAPDNYNDSDISPTFTRYLLRTPDKYGYFSLVYNRLKPFIISYTGVLTGPMIAPHVIDTDNERTTLKTTPSFFENNIKLTYNLNLLKSYNFSLFGGAQNIFNSYQKDFDKGINRDAGYVYGPLRSRTFFMGLKFGVN